MKNRLVHIIFIVIIIIAVVAITYNLLTKPVIILKPVFYIVPSDSSALINATLTEAFTTFSSGYAIFTPDIWNIKDNSIGVTMMNVTPGSLEAKVDYTSVTAQVSQYIVVGYPEVIYGYKPWGQLQTSTNSFLPLPLNVSELPNFYSVLNYSVNATKGYFDYSYDIWITRHFGQNGAYKGDIEMMIWMYWRNLQPAGRYYTTIYIPAYVDGKIVNVSWQVWIANGTWTIITFRISNPIPKGVVGVDIPIFIKEANQLLVKFDSWSSPLNHYVLNDLEVGMEWGPLYSGEPIFANYTLYQWYIATVT
ncbi:MAG: hypothetical protein OWQ54_04955 [Sulfolobaceae archaeon]|nr:hypothetical protein [Sulfolobaceae archaeon]